MAQIHPGSLSQGHAVWSAFVSSVNSWAWGLAIVQPVGDNALFPPNMISAGQILGGRYRLLDPLGKGGMGTVWRAEHVELGSQVAVKLIHDDLAESSVVRARFRQEAQAAAALGGDHVVRTIDYGVEGETPYIVMELLAGESLQQRLARVGKLSPAALSGILSQVALALDKAHDQGMIHRDLKPGNLFITRADDGRECLKLLDFGTAKLLRKDESEISQTRTGALVGSPAYMSPEQLRGLREIGPAVDIWALGIVAYECLLGQRPFQASSLADLAVRVCSDSLPVPSAAGPVPAGFDDWFAQACARDPLDRFRRAHELAEAFERLLRGRPDPFEAIAETSPPSPGTPAERKDVPSPHEESTGAIARSQSVVPVRAHRSGPIWIYGVGAAAVALGLLSLVVTRSRGPVGEAAGVLPALIEHRDAGAIPAATADAGAARDVRTSPADGLASVRTETRRSPVRAGRPRIGGRATEQTTPPPADKTDGVYGF